MRLRSHCKRRDGIARPLHGSCKSAIAPSCTRSISITLTHHSHTSADFPVTGRTVVERSLRKIEPPISRQTAEARFCHSVVLFVPVLSLICPSATDERIKG